MRFKCKGCGDCCKNFGEEGKCIPLFSWEVEELKKLAEEKKVTIDFEPIKYLLDENSNVAFVYLYGIKNLECSFLENNKCLIYSKRPIICRQFPLLWVASQSKGNEFGAHCLSECSNFNCKEEFERNFLGEKEVSSLDIDFYLKETYGSCFDYALLSNRLGRKIIEIIGRYADSKELKLKSISETELENYSCMPFHEFLSFKGFHENLQELEKIYSEKR